MAFTDIFTFNFNNAVEQTRQIPVTAVPVGTTVLQAGIARGSLDPAIVLAWSIDVSRDGGTLWLPWGAAGTTGGTVFNKDGSLSTESNFTLFLATPADAQTRLRGSLTNSGARMTTTITIRGDTTPIPPTRQGPTHASVAFDNFAHVEGGAVNTLTTSSFTITSATNRGAVLGVIQNANNATAITSTCGGVSGALATGTDTGTAVTGRTLIHIVKNPATGSQTGNMAWVTPFDCSLGVMTASDVDQTTPTNGGTFASGSSVSPAVTVTTTSGDLTFACGWPANTFASPTQTSLWLDGVRTGGGGSRGPGTGTSDQHKWTQATGAWCVSGVNLKSATSAAAASLVFDPPRLIRAILVR